MSVSLAINGFESGRVKNKKIVDIAFAVCYIKQR